MNKLSIALLGATLVVATSTSVFAATSGTQDMSSTVADINTIDLTDSGASFTNVNTTSYSDVAICDINLNNNNPTGFKVTLSSAKSGNLVRYASGAYTDATKEGNVLAYTVSMVGGTGTLGTSAPTLPSDVSLSSDHEISFDTSVDRATVDKVYTVKVSTDANDALFRGTFQDTISITIADI